MLTGRRRASCAGLLVLVPLTVVLLHGFVNAASPTINRFGKTLASPLDIELIVTGVNAPVLSDNGEIRQSVKNIQTRVWILGQVFRFLLHHLSAVVLGGGYDCRRFVEIVKGGIGPLIPLLAACAWLSWTAVKSVLIPLRGPESSARTGIGWILLSFWPALLLASMTEEGILTDNLLLHWMMLFGFLPGLLALALSLWLPN